MIDVKAVLKQLTTEEKISLLEGADKGFTTAIPRLGIPRILLADGPHGVRAEKDTDPAGEKPYTMTGEMAETTAFPCEASMAATWNTPLIGQVGRAIGEECQALNVGVLLGPGANGKRSPLGGRNFEYFSEDPFLSGKMAAAYIRGVQSTGTGTCLKHYALNDQESRRTSVDVHVDERTKREIYLKPFEIAIREAAPWSVMASYNRVDGQQMTENRTMLTDVLRGELGFQGAVVSDWDAVHDKIGSIQAGLSLQMPGPNGQNDAVRLAVQNGELTEEELDARVAEVLTLVKNVSENRQSIPFDWTDHHGAAVQTAQEGMVLLKNEDSTLPLHSGMTIAVLGELAKQPLYVGGGSSSLTPKHLDAPLDALEKEATVLYADGYQGSSTSPELLLEAARTAQKADAVLVFVGTGTSESLDRTDLLLPEAQLLLISTAAKVNSHVILITQCGSAMDYSEVEDSVKAILHVWIPGEGFGSALTNILFGKVSPSGKLAETFPVCLENTPAYPNFPGVRDDVWYQEGLLVGYRYYDSKKIAPQYPFGFGLSYTDFAVENLRLSTDTLRNGDVLTLMVDVRNTGSMTGQEVVQVYLHDKESYLFRPEKELKAFAKVELAPGEVRTITLELPEDAFAYYLPHLGRFAVESGSFDVLVGTSSRNILCRESVEFCSSDEVRMPLDRSDSFKDFLADDRYRQYAQQFLDVLHIDEQHMFYKMILGVNLNQILDLLSIMQIPEETSQKMIQNLIQRQEILS